MFNREAARTLCHLVSEHLIMVDNRTVQATISIGVVPINQTSPSANEVLERAYQSSEKVKLQTQGSGNGIYVYNPAKTPIARIVRCAGCLKMQLIKMSCNWYSSIFMILLKKI